MRAVRHGGAAGPGGDAAQTRGERAGGDVDESSASPGVEGVGFDQVLDRLRAVVDRLENGSLGLEQSLAAFEEGVRLSRKGSELLERAERRVEMLARGATGDDKVVPLPDAGGDADGT